MQEYYGQCWAPYVKSGTDKLNFTQRKAPGFEGLQGMDYIWLKKLGCEVSQLCKTISPFYISRKETEAHI